MNLRQRYPQIKSPEDLCAFESSAGDIERFLNDHSPAPSELDAEEITILGLDEPLANPKDAQKALNEMPPPETPAIPLRDEETFQTSIQLSLQVSEEEHFDQQLQEALKLSLLSP
jgi:hypothetical protein